LDQVLRKKAIESSGIFELIVDNNSDNVIVVLDIKNPDYTYEKVS